MNFDPDWIYQNLIKSGEHWADKEAAASLLEETKKTVLAEQAVYYRNTNMSISESEQRALAGGNYREHLDKMIEARKEANKAKVRYQSMQTLADLRRTEQSTRRVEMEKGL